MLGKRLDVFYRLVRMGMASVFSFLHDSTSYSGVIRSSKTSTKTLSFFVVWGKSSSDEN